MSDRTLSSQLTLNPSVYGEVASPWKTEYKGARDWCSLAPQICGLGTGNMAGVTGLFVDIHILSKTSLSTPLFYAP